jgi:hypothetical protein
MRIFRRLLSAECGIRKAEIPQSTIRNPQSKRRPRRGLTLAELLVAGTVLVLIGGACATLSVAVYSSYEVCRNQATAAQHARVAIDRIEQAVATATASETFPGCLVVNYSAGGETFPDSLAVWRPTAAAADPAGLPRVNELVVFSCDPSAPNRLLEITWPTNTNVVPSPTNPLLWGMLIDSFHLSAQTVKNQLTDRLRVGTVETTPLLESLNSTPRGTIRFQRIVAPSESQWSQYRDSQRIWRNLDWPLDMYSTQTGLRTVNVQVELQIVSGPETRPDPLPFLGSANLSYTLHK